MPHELICMATFNRIRFLASFAGPLMAVLLLTAPARAERVLVSNEKDNTITVLDGQSLAVVATVPVGARPRGIVLSRDRKSLYICTSDADHIEVVGDLIRHIEIANSQPRGVKSHRNARRVLRRPSA